MNRQKGTVSQAAAHRQKVPRELEGV